MTDISSRIVPHAEAAPDLEDCTDLLAASEVYDTDLDLADQRTALLSFFDSTGGPYWTTQSNDDAGRTQYLQLVEGVVEAGYDLASGSLDVGKLPSELVSDAASIASLSENCGLQQYLSLGQLWLTNTWGSNVSYCHWSGITCCQTVLTSLGAQNSDKTVTPLSVCCAVTWRFLDVAAFLTNKGSD